MEEIRKRIKFINESFAKKSALQLSFDEVCKTLAQVMSGNIIVYSVKGKILGSYLNEPEDLVELEDVGNNLTPSASHFLEQLEETKSNIRYKEARMFFRESLSERSQRKYHTLVPIFLRGERLGTLMFARYEREYSQEDLLVGEYVALIIGMEIDKRKQWSGAEKRRSSSTAQNAFSSLSGSEKWVLKFIFEELEQQETNRIISSRVADELCLGRSTVATALRKADVAGMIRMTSYGAKGTGVQILNREFVKLIQKSSI